MPKAVIIDLEVENNPWFQSVASPKCPDNYVVASGWGYCDESDTHGLYFESKPAEPNWAPYLTDPDVDTLVAHNAPFEIDWLMTDHRGEFLAFLKRGGRVFCTAYAHYLLSNQQDTYPSLNEIAPQYGGTPKVDAVKLLWEQGKLTSEIDKALLFDEYLLGPDGDIENTRKVYLAQLRLIAQRGLGVSIWERMHGMLYNALCMHFGMRVDRDLAEQHIAEQNSKLTELAVVINGAFQVPEHLRGEFKSSSQYHLSAALYGGSVAHRHRVQRFKDDGTPYFVKADYYRFGASEKASVRFPVPSEGGSSLAELEAKHGAVIRFKSGKNKGQPKVFREDTDEIDTKWEDTYTSLPGLLDLTKMPKDVHRSWCEDFEQARTMRCGTTVKSTSGDAFEALLKRPEFSEHYELLHALVSQAKIVKDQSTYYLVQEFNDEGEPKKTSGMLQFVQPDGMVHANLNCTSTVTTRLSSTRPNLQNLPRGDEDDTGYQSRVKELFVSRFQDGRILGIDFSNLETYVLADLSKDPALCEALLNDTDMHCLRLAGSLGEPYEDVLRKCKDKTHPEHDKYSAMRTAIKPKSFAYAYGATAAGIAYATGSSVEAAQEFIDAERQLFPRVEDYFDELMQIVEQNVTRHREELGEGQYRLYARGRLPMPCGTQFEFRTHPKTRWVDGQRFETMEFKPTQLRNYPVQGTAAELVQVVAAQIVRWLVSNDFAQFMVIPIGQVHDAYYLDCADEQHAEYAAACVKKIMQSAAALMNRIGYDFSMPYKGDADYGRSMADA